MHVAYSVTSGLAGCYLADNASGPYHFSTRRELADFIRDEIEFKGFPANTFEQAHIRRLWSGITFARSASSYHFSIQHDGREIAFQGLTRAEADAMEAAEL